MILKLKGADFSENNIGIVDLKTSELLNQSTTILNYYTKTATVTMKQAFNTFMGTLIDSGIWDKVQHAYFPFLANDVEEALLCAKTGILINNLPTVPATSAYRLEDKGLCTTEWGELDGYDADALTYADVVLNLTSLSILTLAYYSSAGSTKYHGAVGNFYQNNYKNLFVGSSTSNISMSSDSSLTAGEYYRHLSSVRSPGTALGDYQNMVNGNVSRTSESISDNFTPAGTTKSLSVAMASYSQYFYNNKQKVAMQLFGEGLTDAELLIVDNAMALLQSYLA